MPSSRAAARPSHAIDEHRGDPIRVDAKPPGRNPALAQKIADVVFAELAAGSRVPYLVAGRLRRAGRPRDVRPAAEARVDPVLGSKAVQIIRPKAKSRYLGYRNELPSKNIVERGSTSLCSNAFDQLTW